MAVKKENNCFNKGFRTGAWNQTCVTCMEFGEAITGGKSFYFIETFFLFVIVRKIK